MKKIALITGASKGLGEAWCKFLIEKDYFVIATARDLEKLKSTFSELNDAQITFYKLDVSNESSIKELSQQVKELFGKIDLLVNNAGINPKDFSDKSKMQKAFNLDFFDADVMNEVVRINAYAPILMVKHFRSLLKESSHPVVINISSWLGSVGNLNFGGHYGYVGSKNFLNVLNKSMAFEIKADGIISINVNPGWVQTDMGGAKATFTPMQSVENIFVNIIDKATPESSGKFLNYDGTEHPW